LENHRDDIKGDHDIGKARRIRASESHFIGQQILSKHEPKTGNFYLENRIGLLRTPAREEKGAKSTFGHPRELDA